MISIIIPTYNYACAHLVCDLQKQCEEAQALWDDFCYEIIVADDGSTDTACIDKNAAISLLPNCRYELRENNIGRAHVCNWLISQARYPWVLLIDCDAEVITDDFIHTYWQHAKTDGSPIIVGGIRTPDVCQKGCELRHRYELAAENIRTLEARRARPAAFFSTFNVLLSSAMLQQLRFDERCTDYGYEDALFGIEAERLGYRIQHIDNPLLHLGINDNASFLRNSETALRTLHNLGSPMTDRARVVQAARQLTTTPPGRLFILPIFLLLYKMSKPLLRRNLLSHHPNLKLFALYKLGYYLTIR